MVPGGSGGAPGGRLASSRSSSLLTLESMLLTSAFLMNLYLSPNVTRSPMVS